LRKTEAEGPLKTWYREGEERQLGAYSTCTFDPVRSRFRDRKVVLTWYDARAESEGAEEIRKLRSDLLEASLPDMRMVSTIDAAAFVDTSRPEVGTLYVVRDQAFFRIDSAPLGKVKRKDGSPGTRPKLPAWKVSREIARSVLRRLEDPVFSEYSESPARPERLTPRVWATARGNGPWRAEVYTNQKLAGRPVLARGAEFLQYNARSASRLPRDMVSIRWDGCLNLAEDARVDFRLNGNYSRKFYLDGRVLFRSSKDQKSGTFSEAVEAGLHHIRVEFLPHRARASIALQASIQGSPFEMLGEPQVVFPGLHVEKQWCTVTPSG
jgi:hypothetical protein